MNAFDEGLTPLDDNMSSYEYLRLQTMAKVKACVKNGYPKEEYMAAMAGIRRLYEMAKNAQVRKTWENFAQQFKENCRAYRSGTTADAATPAPTAPCRPPRGTDFSADYPVVAYTDIYPVGVCETTAFADKCQRDNGNVFVVEGVFADDLLLQMREYAIHAELDMRTVDLAACPADKLVAVVQWLAHTHAVEGAGGMVVLANSQCLAQRDDATRCAVARAIDSVFKPDYVDKVQVFLLSTDPDFDFNGMLQAARPSTGATLADGLLDPPARVDSIAVRMPLYRSTKTLVCQRFLVDENNGDDMRLLREKGVALGYNGLLRLMREGSAIDWQDKLVEIYEAQKAAFDTYIAKLGRANIGRIVDSGWGLRADSVPAGSAPAAAAPVAGSAPLAPAAPLPLPRADTAIPEGTYRMPSRLDLDTIDDNGHIKDAVQRLMCLAEDAAGRPIGLVARCGLVVRYAITGGDPLRNVDNLSDEQVELVLSERWLIAYAALSQLMRVPFGELLFDIPTSAGVEGKCSNNGQKIHLNKRYLRADGDTLYEGCDTILHEMFHALQAAAIEALRSGDAEALRYYRLGYGATEGRIIGWRDNSERYYSFAGPVDDGNRDQFYIYQNQVKEADARAFALDALEYSQDIVYDME